MPCSALPVNTPRASERAEGSVKDTEQETFLLHGADAGPINSQLAARTSVSDLPAADAAGSLLRPLAALPAPTRGDRPPTRAADRAGSRSGRAATWQHDRAAQLGDMLRKIGDVPVHARECDDRIAVAGDKERRHVHPQTVKGASNSQLRSCRGANHPTR